MAALVDYFCRKCGTEQTRWQHNLNDKTSDSCDNCGASAEELQRMLCKPKHSGHVSWSKWSV